MNTWGVRRTVGAVAVAAAVAGVGGAAIAAATGSGTHAMGGFPDFADMGGAPALGAPRDAAHHDLAGPEPLHGEFVIPDGRGGFTTRLTQTGVITAISPTAVTARSDDGFTQTYVIHEMGAVAKPPFDVGEAIVIDATREGEAATVSTMRPPLSAGH